MMAGSNDGSSSPNPNSNGNGNGSSSGASTPPPRQPRERFVPLVTVVDFHHARGPEVEAWFGVEEGFDPTVEYDWPLLPFMALSDGAHASEEEFSYFTLLRPSKDASVPATSLFGIACTRQLDASQLINRPADVTRSTVQKAVVVISDNPQSFGMLRTRLSIITSAWFAQHEFTDTEILRGFQESLAEKLRNGSMDEETSHDQNLGMSLRELVHEFKWQTLVLLKCCLLQRKMLFFGSKCDRLCMVQFSLISLIPGLIRNLQDCADPDLNTYETSIRKSTSLRTSDRTSLLTYMGLPLHIFGKGSLFGPYTPLQQLDVLADVGTKSYIVGSTNSLLLQQKDRYSDILINLDDNAIHISSPSLRNALALTTPDRRWIDYITGVVNETWDESNPGRPSTHKYIGSEEFIRTQFEEYVLALISSAKYQKFVEANPNKPTLLLQDVEGNPLVEFGHDFAEAWERTENYKIWSRNTDSHIFDICEPRHPAAGGLTIEDVQRRIAEQVKELHLDEKFAQGREVLGRNLAAGREKATSMISKLYSDMEARRQGSTAATAATAATAVGTGAGAGAGAGSAAAFGNVDMTTKAQQTMQTVGSRAGAYMSSWATWAGEKKKAAGWGGGGASQARLSGSAGSGGSGGGWGWGYGKKAAKDGLNGAVTITSGERDYQMINSAGSRLSGSSAASTDDDDIERRLTMGSRGSLFSTGSSSMPASPRRRPDSSRSDVSSLHHAGANHFATQPTIETVTEDAEEERGGGGGGGEEEGKRSMQAAKTFEESESEDEDEEAVRVKPRELIELEQSVWDSPTSSATHL